MAGPDKNVLPAIFPDQHFIFPCTNEVPAVSIAATYQAAVRVTDQVTILIIKIRILIAALRRKIIYFFTVVGILIYAVGRVAFWLILQEFNFCGNAGRNSSRF